VAVAYALRLEDGGHRSALVWVVRGNPARYFYERLGGRQVMHRPIPVAGQPVEAIAYGWRNLATVLGQDAQKSSRTAGEPPVE